MSAGNSRSRWNSAFQALALVVGFWWLATGLLLGLPRTPAALQAASVVASLIGGSGIALAVLYRQDTSPRAAWIGFLAGATLWGWTQAALYGGWLVGPGAPSGALPSGDRVALVMTALRATAWSEAATAGVLILTAILAVGAANRMPFWTVLLFWSAHQAARLNVLFGVANSGSEFLPPHLAFLKQFFGPAINSPLLPVTVAVWVMVTVLLVRRAWRSPDLYVRHSGLTLGVLSGLAALEHVLLGIPASLPLWNLFVHQPK
ncbi:MAG: DUF3623 family protein [Gemmatimonadales bacterium]